MKLMGPEVYTRYSKILKRLRSGGRTLGLLEMQAAADLVLALEEGDDATAADLAERLDVDLEALPGD